MKDQKKPTPEKLEEERALMVKNTLESKLIQEAVGGNLVKSDPWLYGKLGVQSAESIYDNAMNSEDAQKEKNRLFQKKKEEGKKLGVYGDPPPTSHYDLSVNFMGQLNEVLEQAKIGELEKYSKAIGAELVEIPEEFKNFSKADLIRKAIQKQNGGFDGMVDLGNLSETERDAFVLYEKLSEAYKITLAKNVSKGNYLADINSDIKQITEKYKKDDNKGKW